MPIIDWSESLRVGVNTVDEQHVKLVTLVNQLYDAMVAGKGKVVVGQVLTELIDYTVYHFKTEEEFFKKYGYPNAADHIREHNDLTRTAKELKVAYDSNKATVTFDTMKFLKDWLVNHIMKSDKAFGPFLAGKGQD